MHVIYLLAKDSKDKKLDVKGKIEKIILKGNKHLKKRINKQFRYDITKEGKVDVSFVRSDKTKKEIGKLNPDPVANFGTQIVRNGFYHPKKIYTVFYQENYYWKAQNRNAEGIMSTIEFRTPTGFFDFPVVTDYIPAAPQRLGLIIFTK